MAGITAGSFLKKGLHALRAGNIRQLPTAQAMPLRMEAIKRALARNQQEYEFIISAPPPVR